MIIGSGQLKKYVNNNVRYNKKYNELRPRNQKFLNIDIKKHVKEFEGRSA
jgi:hypothetical protein